MDFPTAIKSGFINYINFKTRASRSEFWWFTLFIFLGNFALSFFGLDGLFFLATLVPCSAVSIRRLHDINLSGWWILLSLTIIGIIPLIYLHCLPSNEGENKFGKNPLKG